MKVCLFSSYSELPYIPSYVEFYIRSLAIYFEKIILVTNRRYLEINEAWTPPVQVVFVENEGYDFGMYLKVLNQDIIDWSRVDELALVNDSCVCFRSLGSLFDFIADAEAELLGITDSIEVRYHVQSYFLYFKGHRAINILCQHLKATGLLYKYEEVIRVYETGISELIRQERLKIAAFLPYLDYYDLSRANPVLYFAKELIDDGCPIVKKKVLLGHFTGIEKYFMQKNEYNYDFDFVNYLTSQVIDVADPGYIPLQYLTELQMGFKN